MPMSNHNDDLKLSNYPNVSRLINKLAQIRQLKGENQQVSPSSALVKNQKILVFGSGQAAERFFEVFQHDYQILAFIDNDQNKQGQYLKGLPIISPSKIESFSFDVIYIASQYYREIYRQLIQDLAVSESKVRY